MAHIIQHNVVITKWDSVIERFNNHLAGKLLVVLDDATWEGYKEGVGMLNNLVISNTLLVEEKRVSPITLKNFARVVMIGNEEWL